MISIVQWNGLDLLGSQLPLLPNNTKLCSPQQLAPISPEYLLMFKFQNMAHHTEQSALQVFCSTFWQSGTCIEIANSNTKTYDTILHDQCSITLNTHKSQDPAITAHIQSMKMTTTLHQGACWQVAMKRTLKTDSKPLRPVHRTSSITPKFLKILDFILRSNATEAKTRWWGQTGKQTSIDSKPIRSFNTVYKSLLLNQVVKIGRLVQLVRKSTIKPPHYTSAKLSLNAVSRLDSTYFQSQLFYIHHRKLGWE